ncbi:hypothetical protein FA048_09120 [Pedobacter polaris]|uniref:Uncharacterized protein n=1 Tax=Pedobacter polaris TaxID=2571273 RepID=A0A4U1CQP9_9SPHI|nr:hypothetical protein [Pedobacter polaris]TKC10341.1 hypothetical protein FA048_09120 [Pedobacter polaris]
MTIKDFLLEQANAVVTKFDDIRIRLSYNELSDIHFMEIHPESAYNDEIKLFLSYVMDDFYNIFPEDSLSFVTECDLIDSSSTDEWVTGENFQMDWNLWFENTASEFIVEPVYADDSYFIAA